MRIAMSELTNAHLEMMLCTPDAGVVPGAYGA